MIYISRNWYFDAPDFELKVGTTFSFNGKGDDNIIPTFM